MWCGVLLLQVRVATSYAMHLFGGVDEEEEECECTRDRRRTIERQVIDAGEQLIERRRIRLLAPARPASAAQPFHGLERLLALQSANDGAEGGGEQTNVVVKRKVFGARLGRQWRSIADCGLRNAILPRKAVATFGHRVVSRGHDSGMSGRSTPMRWRRA